MGNTDNYRRHVAVMVGCMAALLIGIGVFVYMVDPYQQYRRNDRYVGNQRLEIAGVARNHDYDAFFTGSSMTMNHYPGLADSLWGWKTKNFSIMGATDDDYATMLPFILERGKARNIIIGIDFFSFARRRGAVNAYLYDDNRLNDYEYLWNYTSLKNAIGFLRNPLEEEGLYHFNSPVGRERLLSDYSSKLRSRGYEGEIFDEDQMKKRFDESLGQIIAGSADTVRWHVYFPPYSICEFIIYDREGDLDACMALKKHIISRLGNLDNVDIYDFQRDGWITDLDQYMDLRHHSHGYNRAIFQAIHAGDFRVEAGSDVEDIHRLVSVYADSLDVFMVDR